MPDNKSLIDLSHRSENDILKIFNQCLILKSKGKTHFKTESPWILRGTAALLFFEPSTRTRFSFETACLRSGVYPMLLDGSRGTSLEKGESMLDTILNLEKMGPLFFIIRCPDSFDLMDIQSLISVPVLNAGWGMKGHPTQALLDIFSLFERWNNLSGKKILFIGDIKHSRVVQSHIELSKILNYDIGFSTTADMIPKYFDSKIKIFNQLSTGLDWADAVICLRVQKERHQNNNLTSKNNIISEFKKDFGLNLKNLKFLKTEGFILHPGPINYGIEIEKEVLSDPRSIILQQVENGVYMRETLVKEFFL